MAAPNPTRPTGQSQTRLWRSEDPSPLTGYVQRIIVSAPGEIPSSFLSHAGTQFAGSVASHTSQTRPIGANRVHNRHHPG